MALLKLALFALLAAPAVLGARRLRGNQERDQRSLTEECVDVPKEVCTRSRTNPRKVKKPVVKKWCYVPSEESGLA